MATGAVLNAALGQACHQQIADEDTRRISAGELCREHRCHAEKEVTMEHDRIVPRAERGKSMIQNLNQGADGAGGAP